MAIDLERITDTTNGKLLCSLHGERIRFQRGSGQWMLWNGKYWEVDQRGAIFRLAAATVARLRIEAQAACVPQADDSEEMRVARKRRLARLMKEINRCENKDKLQAMLCLATNEEGISVLADELDANPMLLNVQNGTINLRTGELHPHDPKDLLTKVVGTTYEGIDAHDCQYWKKFVHEIMCGDEEMVRYLQMVFGYALTGCTTEQCFFILTGTGANGKSTLVDTFRSLLSDYARQAEFKTFMERKSEAPREDIVRLRGARFVAASEGQQGARLDEGLIKSLTGDDTVTARALYRSSEQFTPAHKLFLSTNHRPVIHGVDDGIWRRIHFIPFERSFDVTERDKTLKDKLKGEYAGILAWAVRGCLLWLENKELKIPEKVRRATEEYRQAMDPLALFFQECCELGDEKTRVQHTPLYEAYASWAKGAHQGVMSKKSFGELMAQKGFESTRYGPGNFWKGVKLLPNPCRPGSDLVFE